MSRRRPVESARPGPAAARWHSGARWGWARRGRRGLAGLQACSGQRVAAGGSAIAQGKRRRCFRFMRPGQSGAKVWLPQDLAPTVIHCPRPDDQSALVGPPTGGQAPSAHDWSTVSAPLSAGGPWKVFFLRSGRPSPFRLRGPSICDSVGRRKEGKKSPAMHALVGCRGGPAFGQLPHQMQSADRPRGDRDTGRQPASQRGR